MPNVVPPNFTSQQKICDREYQTDRERELELARVLQPLTQIHILVPQLSVRHICKGVTFLLFFPFLIQINKGQMTDHIHCVSQVPGQPGVT